jgi:enoyl-CoA hydratase/carnithine racemase
MALVETELSNGVLTITLCDVDRRNALSRQLMKELLEAVNVVDRDPQVRVAVLTNRGTVFSAGANLAEQTEDRSSGGGPAVALDELFGRVRDSPKPFVGRIAGHCVAGGVGLAAVMDISVALDTAMFGFSEVRVGVAPAMISVVCLPKMRLADAQSAFLRGNRFAASEAQRMGLINNAVPAQDLDETVASVVKDLLAGEPHALAVAKRLAVVVPSLSADEAFAWTAKISAELFESPEAREGMSAFLEKRPAAWVQRPASDGVG